MEESSEIGATSYDPPVPVIWLEVWWVASHMWESGQLPDVLHLQGTGNTSKNLICERRIFWKMRPRSKGYLAPYKISLK